MGKKSFQKRPPRIPLPIEGIQANGCRNPTCENFLKLSSIKKSDGTGEGLEEALQRGGGSYRISGTGKNTASLVCEICSERKKQGEDITVVSTTLKSNKAVHEELTRISRYLDDPEFNCPNEICDSNLGKKPFSVKKNGKTKSGNQRFQCLHCGKSFSERPRSRKQTKPHVNKLLFKLLVNKEPVRRIAELLDLSESTVYDKIRFIHRQCLEFAKSREKKLERKKFERLYLSTDRQVLMTNWSHRDDKRNSDLYGIATACLNSSYVFAFNFNYDGAVDAYEAERETIESGDYDRAKHHRKHARIWLAREFDEAVKNRPPKEKLPFAGNLRDEIKIKSFIDQKFNLSDASENIDANKQLPVRGALVHNEYTMMAHFFLLKRLFASTEKTRFFLDLDSGMKTAYISAFREEIAEDRSDGFLVRTAKNKTNDEKEQLVAKFRKMVSVISGIPVRQLTFKDLMEVTNNIIAERLKKPIKVPNSPEWWIEHPWVSKAEPEKMVAAVTDLSKYDTMHQANLYRMVTLAPVERFFMNIRRMSMYFERPFQSGTGMGRIWHGYSAYNPEMYTIIGDIFRVHYNYCSRSTRKVTPAMKLGLAKTPIAEEKILYYRKYQ
jgi:transposase-like protein